MNKERISVDEFFGTFASAMIQAKEFLKKELPAEEFEKIKTVKDIYDKMDELTKKALEESE